MVATCEERESTWPTIAATALATLLALGYAATCAAANAIDRLRGEDSDDETSPPSGLYT